MSRSVRSIGGDPLRTSTSRRLPPDDIAGGPVAAPIRFTWPRVYLDHLLARPDERPA